MDKTVLKTFAANSRNKLIEDTIYRLNLLGITENDIQDPIEADGMQTFQIGGTTFSIYDDDINKRKEIINDIESKGFENFVEEVAYTWFNRIIAIRYMEVNNYLPTKTRVLSSETEGKLEPDILTDALNIDLDYTQEDKELIFKLKDENKLDELFRFLFIKQSNKLNEILPGLFETTNDSLELLLNISFTSEESVVRQLIDTIPEEDFTKQVEIIGWLYQYYISEKKDQVININKSNIKKDDIPAATQLFTTDWVVKYMVDNSLGRYWIERNPNTFLKEHLEYYLGEAEQDEETQRKLDEIRSENISIEELTFFDPCMGSGHILVYAFDVFFEIYKELGYLERDIPELILKNNIFGLDIDDRAYQLSYFAVLMKARKFDRKILQKGIVPNVYAIQESVNISDSVIDFIQKHDETIVNDVIYLKEVFKSGKEFGSLIQVKNIDFSRLRTSLNEIIDKSKSTLTDINITNIISNDLIDLVNQAELLSNKYSAVVTNPPYMNKFEKSLKDFAKKYYKDYSKDLFSMFIYRNFKFCKKNGYLGFLTPFIWMFLKTYEKLRKYILNNKNISSLIQLEYNAFTEVAMVPVCTYILNNTNLNQKYNSNYLKLSEFKGDMNVQKIKVLNAINNEVDYSYISNSKKFLNIPGNPIAYWINDTIADSFKSTLLEDIAILKSGRSTNGLNDELFKYWFEVDFNEITFNALSKNQVISKYIPLNKGGSFRRWYGNKFYVSLKEFAGNNEYEFKESITWSDINSSTFSARLHENGIISNNVSKRAYFIDKNELFYNLGYMNTNLCQYLLELIIPTIHFDIGYVGKLPISGKNKKDIIKLVEENIELSKLDWDDYEISWNYKTHPFIRFNKSNNLNMIFNDWSEFKIKQFNSLKSNEIVINEHFNEIYNAKDIISNEIIDERVSITLADYNSDIKSFISYAIGCMFGRYSLDQEGLQFADKKFNINNYYKFIPDDDNIIPVLDTAYFDDDIVGYFTKFVETCFGSETLEENLDFIAGALSKSNKPSREIIRQYLLKNFFNDHKKTYKKCPIYWQFSSGKQNGFNCLVYMHRYEPNLVARIRTDYLHKTQKAIEQRIENNNNIISNSTSKQEVTKATKEKVKLQKQLKETQEYDEVLAHIANQNIEIDLDDGVKTNYAKFQNIEIKKEGSKTRKVNLLKKI